MGETQVRLYAEAAGDVNSDLKALLPWWLDEAATRSPANCR